MRIAGDAGLGRPRRAHRPQTKHLGGETLQLRRQLEQAPARAVHGVERGREATGEQPRERVVGQPADKGIAQPRRLGLGRVAMAKPIAPSHGRTVLVVEKDQLATARIDLFDDLAFVVALADALTLGGVDDLGDEPELVVVVLVLGPIALDVAGVFLVGEILDVCLPQPVVAARVDAATQGVIAEAVAVAARIDLSRPAMLLVVLVAPQPVARVADLVELARVREPAREADGWLATLARARLADAHDVADAVVLELEPTHRAAGSLRGRAQPAALVIVEHQLASTLALALDHAGQREYLGEAIALEHQRRLADSRQLVATALEVLMHTTQHVAVRDDFVRAGRELGELQLDPVPVVEQRPVEAHVEVTLEVVPKAEAERSVAGCPRRGVVAPPLEQPARHEVLEAVEVLARDQVDRVRAVATVGVGTPSRPHLLEGGERLLELLGQRAHDHVADRWTRKPADHHRRTRRSDQRPDARREPGVLAREQLEREHGRVGGCLHRDRG
jgi:hypothetical protein